MYYSNMFVFFFNDPATTEIYTLSLHDALPILSTHIARIFGPAFHVFQQTVVINLQVDRDRLLERSEEHTSELQSPDHLVCRLLLEKKKERRAGHLTESPARRPLSHYVSECGSV